MSSTALWNDLAAKANLTLSPEQIDLLSRYLDLLLEANQRMNLTRIASREAAEVQHVGDAMTLLPYLPPGAHRLSDIGSGGGIPGLPLAIVRPDVNVMLIEATKKKASFLKSTADKLGLKNVGVSEWRAEDVGHTNSREAFDIVVVRAVATMDWLAEWCLPLVKKGGKLLAMKGPRIAEELPMAKRAIKLLGGGEAVIHPVELPGTENRVIVEFPKTGKTPLKYPRPATQAKGRSLGDVP